MLENTQREFGGAGWPGHSVVDIVLVGKGWRQLIASQKNLFEKLMKGLTTFLSHNSLGAPFRHCPQAGSLFHFRLQHFVFYIIMCYILLSTALRPLAGFRYFILSHLQKAEFKFGGMNSSSLINKLTSSFLFSQKILSFLYLVPTYHKYLGSTYKKPLFEMKIGQFQGIRNSGSAQ
jgi:hypothetical protein